MAVDSISRPMARAQSTTAAAAADHVFLRWFAYMLVAGAFFLIEHSWDAQARFTEMIGARSPDELATSEMFQTSSFRQLGAVALGVFGALVLLFTTRKERAPLGGLGAIILFYLAWNGMSLVWADDPGVTFRRYVMLVLLCLGAYGVQAQLTLRQLAFFTLLCPGVFLLLGIAAEASNGTLTPFSPGYRFAGTLHPNTQAVNCALVLLAAWSLFRSEKRGQLLYIAAMLLAVAFLYFTKSRTALAAIVAVIALHWTLTQSRGIQVAVVAFVLAAIAGAYIVVPIAGERLNEALKLGRLDLEESTSTLTGRTKVWEQALEYYGERPVLGFGYGGFWNEERTTDFIERQQWPVPHAHNAYLDILLEGGPVAALAYVLILLVALRKCFVYAAETGDKNYHFLGIVLLFCAMNGMMESIAIQRSLITFLCMAVLVVIAFRQPEQAPPAQPA
jgi:exopolysaccharide production protein ExoQ